MRQLAVVTCAAGLACSPAEPSHDVCLAAEEIAIIDADGIARLDQLATIRDAARDFFALTGRSCLPVETIEVVETIAPPPGFPDDFQAGGLHRPSRNQILLRAALDGDDLATTTQHELCHALDGAEDLVSRDDPLWRPAEGEEPAGYPASLHTGELFARACEGGPRSAREVALREHYGAEVTDRDRFLIDEVFWERPELEAPLRFDLEPAPRSEAWLPPDDSYVDQLAVTRQHVVALVVPYEEDGRIAVTFLGLDPTLHEVAVHEVTVPAAWGTTYADALWAWEDAVVLLSLSGSPVLRVGLDGTTEELVVQDIDEPMVGGVGAVASGVAVGAAYGADGAGVSAIDLMRGHGRASGLPRGTVPRLAWTEGGAVALATDEGVWRGGPVAGWHLERSPGPAFDVPIGEGWWLGDHRYERRNGLFTRIARYAVGVDADGVEHYPDTWVWGADVAGSIDGRWRTVSRLGNELSVTTWGH